MRVPSQVNPQTRAPNQQVGYQRALEYHVAEIGQSLARAIDNYSRIEQERQAKKENFDISQQLLDEADARATDFQDRTQQLAAPDFVEKTVGDYHGRTQAILEDWKQRGYSEEARQELAARLGQLDHNYLGEAIKFKEHSNTTVADSSAGHLGDSGSAYVLKNPYGLPSALTELKNAMHSLPIDEEHQLQLYDREAKKLTDSAAIALGRDHPEEVLGHLAPGELDRFKKDPTGAPNVVAGNLNPTSFFKEFVSPHEGSKLVKDSNGADVKYGVNAAFNPGTDVRNITEDQAAQIFRDKYFIPSGADKLPPALAAVHADTYWLNQKKAMEILNQSGGSVDKYVELRQKFLDGLAQADPKKYGKYQKGWTNRTNELLAYVKKLEGPEVVATFTPDQAYAVEPTAVKTDNPILDLLSGSQQAYAVGAARSELARRAQDAKQADAETKAAERQAHAERFNTLLNGLYDGTLNQVDIDNAYRSGWLTDYDERKKAQDIVNAREKKDDDLARFHFMWKSGEQFNPYDQDAQKAADAGFDAAIKDLQKNGQMDQTSPVVVAGRIWEKTGILPKQGAVMLRGGMVSTNPSDVAASASVASNMLAKNPNAFAGVEGGDEITKTAATYKHYVDDLGMSSQDAANKISTMNTPEAKIKVKSDEAVMTKFKKDVGAINVAGVINNALLGPTGLFHPINSLFGADRGTFTEPQKAEANQTFLELATDHFEKYHDQGAAIAYAKQRMGALYGIEGGQIVKFPPSKAYPEIQGSRSYILDQAKTYVDSYAGFKVPREQIFLVPTGSGSTANAYRAGQPVPYEIHFFTVKDGQTIYHVIPGQVFTADVGLAQREAARKAKEYEQRVKAGVTNTQELAPERFNLGGF